MRGAASQLPSLSADWINFYSRASCEARQVSMAALERIYGFLLTRLMRGAAKTRYAKQRHRAFLLTRLMRGAASCYHIHLQDTRDFYSRASCEARRVHLISFLILMKISTHAPHARRGADQQYHQEKYFISTHAPHARRGGGQPRSERQTGPFLLTRLMRGAANSVVPIDITYSNFYSRASCEARPYRLNTPS